MARLRRNTTSTSADARILLRVAQAYETHLEPDIISSYASVQRAVFEFLNETKTTLPLDADQLALLTGFLVERRNIQ